MVSSYEGIALRTSYNILYESRLQQAQKCNVAKTRGLVLFNRNILFNFVVFSIKNHNGLYRCAVALPKMTDFKFDNSVTSHCFLPI